MGQLGFVTMKKLGPPSGTTRFNLTSSSQRRTLLIAIATIISVIGLTAAALCITVLNASSNLSDRLVEVGDIVAGATLILAIVAAIVALLAYAASTGLPELRIQVDFPFSELNKPSFSGALQEIGAVQAENFKQLVCTIRVRNDSSYSAKNPAIVVRLHDMAFVPDGDRLEKHDWAVIQFVSTHGVTVVQWDGGANYSIHGSSVRTLPDLFLNKLHTIPKPDPWLDIDILAEGYSRQIRIPVEFKPLLSSTSLDEYSDGRAH